MRIGGGGRSVAGVGTALSAVLGTELPGPGASIAVRRSRGARECSPLAWCGGGRGRFLGVGLDFNRCRRQAKIQITPPSKRPPVIEKNFQRPPIRNPAQNQEALFQHTSKGKLNQISAYHVRGNVACDQNRNADREGTATNAKKLVEVALEKVGTVGEISGESFAKLSRGFGLSFAIRDMDDDRDRLVGSQFARPTDDVFLRLSVKIALAKRKWVEAYETAGRSCRREALWPRLGLLSSSCPSPNRESFFRVSPIGRTQPWRH